MSATTTAIILAAGVGKRFGAEMNDKPKALLEVGGETLIARLVRQLREGGVTKIVIVVGYRGELIERELSAVPGVSFLHNPEYRRGAILSLWTAREHLGGPALVMDADVFLPSEMMLRLLRSAHENCFLLDGSASATGEEQMLHVRDGRVTDIARKPRGAYDLLGESVGFLRLGADGARVLRELLDARVAAGVKDIEHEEVYPELLSRVVTGFERVDDLDWTEIDFPEDLERARALAIGRRD
ncbi:MAG: phosphocholine cytidylyltransferase family protein [Deltaproteobacteria bacterium]|nr:phosphocholine cytidylyltransferase family protein [Deltaproteobacteria bacterium]